MTQGKKKPADMAVAQGGHERTEAAVMKRTVARLNFQQRTKLVEALQARRDDILRDEPHPADVADEMSKAVGFPVTPQHVRTGMEDSGVSWKPGRRKGTWPVSRLRRLREEVVEAAGLSVFLTDDVPEADLARLEAAGRAFSEVVRRLSNGGEEE